MLCYNHFLILFWFLWQDIYNIFFKSVYYFLCSGNTENMQSISNAPCCKSFEYRRLPLTLISTLPPYLIKECICFDTCLEKFPIVFPSLSLYAIAYLSRTIEDGSSSLLAFRFLKINQLLCGFHKAHLTQHVLFRLIYLRQKGLDESGFVGTILMDLSKAYDCLPHDLMIAKLEVLGLAKESLQLISDYLSCHKQRTKLVLNLVTAPMSFANSSRLKGSLLFQYFY